MIWLESTVEDFDVMDASRRLGTVTLVTIFEEDESWRGQLGTLVSVEKFVNNDRQYVAFMFKQAGYLFVEGPLTRIQIETTPDQDEVSAEVGRILDEWDKPEPEKPGLLDRTLGSFLRRE